MMKNKYYINGDHAIVEVISKGQTYKAKLDIEDLERFIAEVDNNIHLRNGYPSFFWNGKAHFLHRYVLGFPEGMVDHKDHDLLDARKNQLREADFVTNGRNRKGVQKNNLLGLRGVGYNAQKDRYISRIYKNKKTIYVGLYKTPEEAFEAAERARKDNYGEYAGS